MRTQPDPRLAAPAVTAVYRNRALRLLRMRARLLAMVPGVQCPAGKIMRQVDRLDDLLVSAGAAYFEHKYGESETLGWS